jgi:hypothetical protein
LKGGLTDFEAEDGLEVLSFHADPDTEPIAEVDGMGDRGLFDDLVDLRAEYELDVVWGAIGQ